MFTRLTAYITLIVLSAAALTSCHGIDEYANDPRGNFEALWSIIDEHYCFLDQKGIDWQNVHDRYAVRISDRMTSEELFIVCADMLDELRDGHVNLSASFNTSYYRAWSVSYTPLTLPTN
ncbi:MAG: peptidase S41, partial [Duncaniella sp.]|nr:peptidase S41 [Duncaniella sp.]